MKIITIPDIHYCDLAPTPATAGSDHCLLDLYLPEEVDEPVRPILIIHGGGWCTQHRKGKREVSIAHDLAAAGFAAASIDYTLIDVEHPPSSGAVWPRMLTDCKQAVRFLRDHAEEYGIDATTVGAIGGSAGAHLAAMLGVTSSSKRYDPPGGADCSVQAVVYLYGVADIASWMTDPPKKLLGMRAAEIMLGGTPDEQPDLYRAASPICSVTADIPPMLLAHGTADELIPVAETIRFHRILQEAGATAELIVVPDAPHSFDLHPRGLDLEAEVCAFFHRHLAAHV